MDGTTHTLIATGLMLASYLLGRFFAYRKGKEEGASEILLIVMECLNVTQLHIDEEAKTIDVQDHNGRKRYLKLSTRK
jgi:hypothetical protein